MDEDLQTPEAFAELYALREGAKLDGGELAQAYLPVLNAMIAEFPTAIATEGLAMLRQLEASLDCPNCEGGGCTSCLRD